MFEQYWGLKANPFKNTLDSRFIYTSNTHKQALEMFNFIIKEHMGVAVLTGLLGSGKTFLAHVFLERLKDEYKLCLINNPKLNIQEFLREVLYQLNIRDDSSTAKIDQIHAIENTLKNNFSEGKETIIIIDEAQAIEDPAILEELRLLINLYLEQGPLFSLFLLGHSQLEEKISSNKALSQRIAVKFHLDRLTEEESLDYVNHRLDVAGKTKDVFNPDALRLVSLLSGGIPRRINNLCGMALFLGMQRKSEIIDESIVREVNNYLIV